MGTDELIARKREQILALAAKYGASHVRVFGSVARGTADEDRVGPLQRGCNLPEAGKA